MLTPWLAGVAAVALAGPCELEAPPDAPFRIRPPEAAGRVHLLVEVWAEADDRDWALSVLGALSERELTGVVVVPLPPPPGASDALLSFAEAVEEAGHEVAVAFDAHDLPRDLNAPVRPLRARLRALRRASGGVRTMAGPLPGKAQEALLGRAGFRAFLPTDGPPTATPRLSAVFEGQPKTNVVFQTGPYGGPCGTEPGGSALTPLAADRVARAIEGAIRSGGAPTVRLVLESRHARDTDAEVLGRWLDEVVLPAGIPVASPLVARKAALHAFRTHAEPPEDLPPAGGRLVAVDQVQAAAASLAGVQILPRTLPGDLGLTEAYYAFLLVLADEREGDVVRLGALQGPPSKAGSVLGQEDVVEIERYKVVAFAEALLAELPDEVPVSMRLDGHVLTAPELLGLLASAVRGDDPAVTRISASPDPNERGLGWGSSSVP